MTYTVIETGSPIPVEQWAQCPVCGEEFAQAPGAGRPKVFCSDRCRNKEFRNVRRVTKLSETERAALVEKHLFIGNWQLLDRWPAWPGYRCLACAAPIRERTPAWHDRNDWDQLRGVYRRHICANCHPKNQTLKGSTHDETRNSPKIS